MAARLSTAERARRVAMCYRAIKDAAAAGERMPSRDVLARIGGWEADQSGADAVRTLVTTGKLRRIGTDKVWPVYEVVATGQRTAARPPKVVYEPKARVGIADLVLPLLVAAAEAGRPCPSNNAMADELMCDPASVSLAVRQLSDRRVIEIGFAGRHKRTGRFVTILETGAKTAPAAGGTRTHCVGEPSQRSDVHRKNYVPVAEQRAQSYDPPALGLLGLAAVEAEDRELADQIHIESLRIATPRAKLVRDLLWLGWAVHLDNVAAGQTARG